MTIAPIRFAPLALLALVTTALTTSALTTTASAAPAPGRDALAAELVATALPEGSSATGRDLFLGVLASDLFLRQAVGPFDVHVLVDDGLGKAGQARKLLERASEGLAPAADAVSTWFPGERGVVAGRRFPIVLVDSDRDDDELGFDRLLALLDRCEDEGYSGYKPFLQVYTARHLGAADVFTWEVLVVNVAHTSIADRGKLWFDHGIGYAALNLIVNRLFAKGAYGPAPPWLKDGLLDELDIQAYGDAWVAAGHSTSFASKGRSWKREGWSGFVPQGSSPPPPVKGPPPGLSSRMMRSVLKDDWLDRSDSEQRHWGALVTDRRGDTPASLLHMAAGSTFTYRDRAYSRAVLHLLMDLAPAEGDGLLRALDVEGRVGPGGMSTAEPLPLVVSHVLGDLPDVAAYEARTAREFLADIGRDDLVARFEGLDCGALLDLTDHREQARALSLMSMPDATRQTVYQLLIEVENYQQLQEWQLVGEALDRAAGAALDASRSYPRKDKARDAVAEVFREQLAVTGG